MVKMALGVSLILNLCMLSLCLSWRAATAIILQTNASLLNQPHPVHDADLTVWHDKGTITVMVNGAFPHIYEHFCTRL